MNANKRKILEDAGILYPSVVTNADRIRAMSDEELAEFIGRCVDHEFQFECVCFLNQFGYCQYPTRGCNENALEWLKQEADT